MDSNKHKTTSGNTVLSSIVNMCSINICGMSDRSRFVLDKFCYDKSIDILAVQESTTVDVSNLDLKFMTHTSDANNSMNKGAMLYVNNRKLGLTPLSQLSKLSSNIDTAWGLVSGKGFRYIVGSVYLKLNYKGAINDLIKMLQACHSNES